MGKALFRCDRCKKLVTATSRLAPRDGRADERQMCAACWVEVEKETPIIHVATPDLTEQEKRDRVMKMSIQIFRGTDGNA